MVIKEIMVTKEVILPNGQKVNVSLSGVLGACEDFNEAQRTLEDILDFKVSIPSFKRPLLPTREDWVELRQMVKKKTGYRDDDAIQSYIKDKLGTQNLELVSGQEIRQLIAELKAAA